MGKCLKELTNDVTKCMVKVNGVPLIQRMLSILDRKNLEKIIIVVGYKSEVLMDYINSLSVQTPIEYVTNPIYNKTNNIYSLYLARHYLLQDDTLLLESDLIFEERALDRLLCNPYPNLVLAAKFESWMDGTVLELDEDDNITSCLLYTSRRKKKQGIIIETFSPIPPQKTLNGSGSPASHTAESCDHPEKAWRQDAGYGNYSRVKQE